LALFTFEWKPIIKLRQNVGLAWSMMFNATFIQNDNQGVSFCNPDVETV